MSDEYILGPASDDAVAQLEALRQAASVPQTPVFDASDPNKRMLFFAFDGTRDNKDDRSLGPMSNVGRLYEAAKSGLAATGAGDAFYYKGPGTQENPVTRVLDGATGMTVPDTVASAYNDLVLFANNNPGVEITIGTTGFSRGAATARAFLNAVWENGIPDVSSRVSLGVDANTWQERFAYVRRSPDSHSRKTAWP